MGNLLIVLVCAIIFGFILIFLITKTSKRKETEEEKIEVAPTIQNLSPDNFFKICCELLERLGLNIVDSDRNEENEFDIYAENPTPIIGGPVMAHCVLYPQGAQVTSIDVMNFSSNLIGERRGKGILITTGFFAPEVATLPELPPIELIDGKRLAELIDQYSIGDSE